MPAQLMTSASISAAGSTVKSASRAIEILEFFMRARQPCAMSEIGLALGYPPSSTTVLLKTLVGLGYLNFDRRTRVYFPTPKVTSLGDWIPKSLFGVSEALIKASEAEAQAMGLQTLRLRVAAPNPDLEGAFAIFRQEHADALLILEEPVVGVHAKRIAELAAKDRLPTIFAPSRVGAGGLIAYGTSQVESIRRMAVYIDKVLKGANPGELSVERITPYELIVNLKTAREIGITMPPEVLQRADRVIQ